MVVVVVITVVAAAVVAVVVAVVAGVVVLLLVEVDEVVDRCTLFHSDYLQVSLVLFFILRYSTKHLRNKQFRGNECC
jgi:hypothetical protein